jgi:beta-lactamase class A
MQGWRDWLGNKYKHLFLSLVLVLIAVQALSGCSLTEYWKPLENSPLPEPDYEPLRSEIKDYIQSQGGRIGVYFRDVRSGASFGINEKEPITAASSIKAPIVLYLFEQVAAGKLSLEEKMDYQDIDYSAGAGNLQFFAAEGARYSLGVLANLAITISDNIAWKMLLRRLGKDNVASYFRSLGGETVYPEGQNISTARDLGIYMQGILDFTEREPELGELLLAYMSHTIFDEEGIPVGVPDGIKVAHKVGTVNHVAADVGIVFLADRPYILTVMTDGVGQSIDDGFAVVEEISAKVYRYQKESVID